LFGASALMPAIIGTILHTLLPGRDTAGNTGAILDDSQN
jgi:hypothetical protein